MGKILEPNSGGPEPSEKPGKGETPITLSSSLHDYCRNNTSPVRYKRIPPSKSFIEGQIICGAGKLGYGRIPQPTRNGLGKRPVVRPFRHCETNPSLFGLLVGGNRGTPYVSSRIAATGILSLYLSPYFSKVLVPPNN